MPNDTFADHYAVQRVITAYSLLTGRGDWEPVLALFTPEATWEIPTSRCASKAGRRSAARSPCSPPISNSSSSTLPRL